MSHEFFPIRNRDLSHIDIEPEYKDFVKLEIEHDQRVFQSFSLRKRLGLRMREKFYSERIYNAYVKPGHRLRVITLVREPVANNISMFFEVLDHYTGTSAIESSLDIDEMIEVFLSRYMHRRPLTWLDTELKRMLGIDVFRHPFPQDQGFATLHADNVDLLVLKLELDDESKARAIADFLGLDSLELVRSNVSSKRDHASKYEEFKRRIRVPDSLLDLMYESKYAKFFYSADELSRYRARWRGSYEKKGAVVPETGSEKFS